MSSAQPSTAYARLVAAAAALKVPDAVRAVASAPPPDPRPDQIWRAAWEATSQLLAITAVDDDAVRAVPVSLERYADAHTLLLPAAASTLEQPLALWWGLAQHVPWCVLDRQVSELTVPLPASMDPGSPPSDSGLPAGARWGSAEPSPAAADAEYRGTVADRMTTLRTARWAPQGSGALPGLLQQRGITARTLATELGLEPARALEVRRGQHPLTGEPAGALAELLGLRVDEVLAANPALPAPVIHELNRPQRRGQLRALAARHLESEHQARHRAAYGIYALAARQDDRSRADWAARTDRYFELHLE